MKNLNKINAIFKGKKVLILGYGREGRSTHKFLIDNNIDCDIYISDQRDIKNDLYKEIEDSKIINPEKFKKELNEYDIIMQSPGVCLKELELNSLRNKLYSQTEVFFELFREQIIGITGTKGKSTTTSLIYKMFKDLNKNVIICGNIGIPFFDMIEDINEDTIIVAELSCHQLEFVRTSPHVGIIINIYPEHLDHYNSFEEYKQTKLNMIKYQDKNDVSIINIDNENIKEFLENHEIVSKILRLTGLTEEMFHMKHSKIYYNNEEIFNENDKRNIIGDHNLYNIMTLFAVAKEYNIDFNDVKKTVANFTGLEHRMELFTEINGVKFYNDSISTIPETCIAALETLKDIDTLIVGGTDRGIDLSKLINTINNREGLKVICINDTGKKIFSKLTCEKYQIDDMAEIAKKAVEITKKICVLSPAAASYGFYTNFEDRGSRFKEEILKYKNN